MSSTSRSNFLLFSSSFAFDDRERKWLGSWLEVKPTFIKTTTTVQKQVEAASVVNYVVKKGDTLWAIAKKYLGSGTKYPQSSTASFPLSCQFFWTIVAVISLGSDTFFVVSFVSVTVCVAVPPTKSH